MLQVLPAGTERAHHSKLFPEQESVVPFVQIYSFLQEAADQ